MIFSAHLIKKILLILSILLLLIVLYILVFGSFDSSKETISKQVEIDLNTIKAGVEDFETDNGYFPSTLNQLEPKYLTKIPVDPWGNSYLYHADGNTYSFKLATE